MKTWILTVADKIMVAALIFALASTFVFAAGGAYATPYGTEITKYDGVGYYGSGTSGEDNETEPGMVRSQVWDLEGLFLTAKNITIVGGFNFYTGQENRTAGDLFIDTDGDAVCSPDILTGYNYNPGYNLVSNGLFKYDYVLDINWAGGTYDIVRLNNDSVLKNTEYGASYNKPSNPWIYVSGGTAINTTPLNFNNYSKASQGDTGFLGMENNNHYVATFDVSLLDLSNGAVFHNTLECGNDNLIGQAAAVPEPTTILLLGLGLAGLSGVRRKFQK